MKSPTVKFAMGRWPSAIALALLASCGGGDGGRGSSTPPPASSGLNATSASSTTFSAALSGTQETPPNASSASGNATASVDPTTKAFSVSVATSGIAGTAAHVHNGAAGVAGPIIFPLTETPPGSGNWSTSVTLTDAQLNVLLAGNYYVNVHSAAFPNGEIRGQLVPTQAPASTGSGGAGGAGAGGGGGGGGGGY